MERGCRDWNFVHSNLKIFNFFSTCRWKWTQLFPDHRCKSSLFHLNSAAFIRDKILRFHRHLYDFNSSTFYCFLPFYGYLDTIRTTLEIKGNRKEEKLLTKTVAVFITQLTRNIYFACLMTKNIDKQLKKLQKK